MSGNKTTPGKAKTGRGPSPDKTAKTREAIAEAALEVFTREGFADARMIDVARAASVAKGTLYLYFPTKEALFEGVLMETMGKAARNFSSTEREDGESVKDFARRALQPLAEIVEDPVRAGMFRLLLIEGTRFPDLVKRYRAYVIAPAMQAIRALSEEGRRNGELSSAALEDHPQLFIAPGLMVMLWNSLFPEEALEPAAVFDGMLDIVFSGSRASHQ